MGDLGEGNEDVTRAVLSGIKGTAALVRGAVAVGTLGLAQISAGGPSAREEKGYFEYTTAPSTSENGGGGRGKPYSVAAAAATAPKVQASGGFSILAPLHRSESMVVASHDSSSSTFIITPHDWRGLLLEEGGLKETPASSAASVAARAMWEGGVKSSHVLARLNCEETGDVSRGGNFNGLGKGVHALAVSPDDVFIVTAQGPQGGIVVWRRKIFPKTWRATSNALKL